MTTRGLAAVAAGAWLVATAAVVHAKPATCAVAITKASAAFGQARTRLLQKCREGVHEGTIALAPGTGSW